jgi:hypothetical protein
MWQSVWLYKDFLLRCHITKFRDYSFMISLKRIPLILKHSLHG